MHWWKIKKEIEKIRNIMGSYLVRKILILLLILSSIIVISFMFIQINAFQSFAKEEENQKAKFLLEQKYKLLGNEQNFLFLFLASLIISFSFIVLILSLIGSTMIFSGKYNGYIFLRSSTWLLIFSAIFAFLILAIKIKIIQFNSDPEDPNSDLIIINGAPYIWTWVILILNIVFAFGTAFARKNYGYLENNINIKRYEKNKKINN